MGLEHSFSIDRLLQMLDAALTRKNDKHKSAISKLSEVESSLAQHHQQIAAWLVKINEKFKLSPETLFLSVTIFDHFLVSVKAHPKYLYCIGVTCYYLAAKAVEEDYMIPDTLSLVRNSGCGCSVAEVLRMERCILDKLNWDLKLATPLDFLHIFHSLLLARCPGILESPAMSTSQHSARLVHRLQTCMLDPRLAATDPATLALAVLSIDLELFVGCQLWLPATITMQAVSQISGSELIWCRELSIRLLISTGKSKAGCVPASSTWSASTKSSKRKVDDVVVDDFYDGIKRLYAEDGTAVSVPDSVNNGSCTCAGEVMRCPSSVQIHDFSTRVNY